VRLGIIAGSGGLAVEVVQAAAASGRDVFVIGLDDETSPELNAFPHEHIRIGQVGRLMRTLARENCGELVFVGGVKRPNLREAGLDLGAVLLLPLVLRLMVGGDESMLTRVVGFFEQRGIVVRGAHEVAPNLLAAPGPLGRHAPGRRDRADIELALRVAYRLGELDVGQGAVVSRGYVLAVEAAEGTDRMLARCGELRQWGREKSRRRMGVLVKRPRPGQELRIDMPVIGASTVERAAAAGLAGIAVAAGAVLLADRATLIREADAAGLFVVGVPIEAPSGKR
jgi:UDP-2,3-diacylglucosamine hydrolase